MSRNDALIAAHRFGFGPKPGEIDRIADDPRGWLAEQVTAPQALPAAMTGLPPSSENVLDWWDAVTQSVAELVKRIRGPYTRIWAREAGARLHAAITTDAPFHERLVWFWGDHFTCSGVKSVTLGMVGGYEREAIRPHVSGRFGDMLLASSQHPGMLFYLDNYRSSGPDSPQGYYGQRGINENLAREILELHTLGVDQGYDQADVQQFAKVLTGWTFARAHHTNAGSFRFDPGMHERGPKTVLGQTYPENGVQEGRDILARLAVEPATAHHLATKLARHFVADAPPPALIEKLERRYLETEGDIAQVSLTLIGADEAWTAPLTKVKRPGEYTVAVRRALNDATDIAAVMAALNSFGNLPFMANSPAGWPDNEAAWLTPDSAVRRARFAQAAVRGRGTLAPDANRTADHVLGDLLPDADRRQLDGLPNEMALAMVLASPAFQRR